MQISTRASSTNSGRTTVRWPPSATRPVVLLTTTGARSGPKRVNPLVALLEGERTYVVASKGGAPTNPDWYYNLVAHPEVEVELGDEPLRRRRRAGHRPRARPPLRGAGGLPAGLHEVHGEGCSAGDPGGGAAPDLTTVPRACSGSTACGASRADYYLSDLGRELPAPVPVRWTGSAAAGLGLDGPADAAGVRCLLSGLHPATGRPIGTSRVTVAAYDLTFSAPKSASVLFALSGEDAARRIVDAHEAAVAGGLAYLEQHGVSAVRRDVVIPTSGMVAGQFTHAVSRNGDPHLHSHVVMANLVHGVDGRWSACDRRGLDAHRQAACSVYEAHLRAGLGVRWTAPPLGRSAEIAGIPPEVLGEFSSRGADIRRHLYETGARSARGRRVGWAATRPAKTSGPDYAEAARDWRRRARAAGGPPQLEPVPIAPAGPRRAPLRRHALADAPRRGPPA